MERPVEFGSGRLTLRGVLCAPAGAKDGVVFVHGWSSYRIGPHRMFVTAARRLAGLGIASLRFDLRGRGESEGDSTATDLDEMIDDLIAAAEFLRAEAGVERVWPVGLCSGGNVVLGAASLKGSEQGAGASEQSAVSSEQCPRSSSSASSSSSSNFAGLVLWSTPLFAPQKPRTDRARRSAFFLGEYTRKLFRRETWLKLVRGKVDFGGVARTIRGHARPEVSDSWHGHPGRDPKDSRRDVMAELVGYRGPTLFVYGSRDDESIGAPDYYAAFCREHGIEAAFHTVEGANHSYYSVAWEREVIEATVGWLAARS